VDSGSGTGFSLKYFLCRHHTTIPFPFICYLQDVHWACERLILWRQTHACTLKQQCALSDELLQPCCTMRVSHQPVPFHLGFFLDTCMVGRYLCSSSFCIIFISKLHLFLYLWAVEWGKEGWLTCVVKVRRIMWYNLMIERLRVTELYINIQFIPHTKHIPSRLYKNQSVNAVWGNNCCLFSDTHKTHTYTGL